jgi:ABC-type sugar transport system substrate-binding protein
MRVRIFVAVAVLAAGIAAAAGAAQRADTGGARAGAGGVRDAKRLVAKYGAGVSWSAPGAALNGAGAKGKKVAYIPIIANIPYTQEVSGAFKEAMGALGVKVVFFGGTQGTPDSWSKAVEEAVAQKVDAIVLQGVNPGLIAPAITHANRAHIPIVEGFTHNLREPHSKGVAVELTYDSFLIGKMMGDYAVATTNGKVKSVVFYNTDTPVTKALTAGINAEFKRLCPSTCSTKINNIVVSDWATKLPLLTRTAVADPKVNVLFPLFDGEVPYVIPSVHSAGAQSRVKVISFNATAGVMKYLANKDVLVADVGDPLQWVGYQFADQAVRLLLKKPTASPLKETAPIRLFTRENFTSATLKKPEWQWYGKTDFRAKFRQLWHVK